MDRVESMTPPKNSLKKRVRIASDYENPEWSTKEPGTGGLEYRRQRNGVLSKSINQAVVRRESTQSPVSILTNNFNAEIPK